MAVSNTPNIGLNLPSKSEQNWDTLLNQNFDKIDNEINNIETSMIIFTNIPLTSTSNGNKGDLSADSNYIYVCYNTNQWIRIPKDSMW